MAAVDRNPGNYKTITLREALSSSSSSSSTLSSPPLSPRPVEDLIDQGTMPSSTEVTVDDDVGESGNIGVISTPPMNPTSTSGRQGDDDDDDFGENCEYMRVRRKNIVEKNAFLVELGLVGPEAKTLQRKIISKRKKKKKPRVEVSSSSSTKYSTIAPDSKRDGKRRQSTRVRAHVVHDDEDKGMVEEEVEVEEEEGGGGGPSKIPKLRLIPEPDPKPKMRITAVDNEVGGEAGVKKKKKQQERQEDEGNILCTECSKRFFRKQGMEIHRRKAHPWLRPFACHGCEGRFWSNGMLLRHVDQVHVNKKPYVCAVCQMDKEGEDVLICHLWRCHEHHCDHPFFGIFHDGKFVAIRKRDRVEKPRDEDVEEASATNLEESAKIEEVEPKVDEEKEQEEKPKDENVEEASTTNLEESTKIEEIETTVDEEEKQEIDDSLEEVTPQVLAEDVAERQQKKDPPSIAILEDEVKEDVESSRDNSNIFDALFRDPIVERKTKILLVGLDGAGTATILHKLKTGGAAASTIPVTRANGETFESSSASFTRWVLGARIDPPWSRFYENTHGVIFVVDSSDRERIDEARNELSKLLAAGGDHLGKAVILVIANKKDLPGAMNKSEVTNKMGLRSLGNVWLIEDVCAASGERLHDSLDFLAYELKNANRG